MSEPLKLAVGDRVVYPNQGLCTVTGIDVKEVAGQRLSFVTLQREEDGSKIMTPEANVNSVGVRKLADAATVTTVFAFLKSDSDKASLDWKARARTNVERMAIGGLMGLAEVVKGLQVLSELRPLPTKERELYNSARHLLVAEIAAALKIPECDAEDAVDVILFPPGKERPKRTAAEFAVGGEDELGMDGDLLGLDGEEPVEDEAAEGEGEAKSDEDAEGGDDEAPAKKPAKGKAPAKAKAKVIVEDEDDDEDDDDDDEPKRSVVSDVEVTTPTGSPLVELSAPKKRGRPPKPKPDGPPPEPKKRGRPPKPKPEGPPPEPKKRGRPPKLKK